MIGKKWTVTILNLLSTHGPLGYNTLFHKISRITPKAFGDKLKLLMMEGWIKKIVSNSSRHVVYQLTKKGGEILASLQPLLKMAK